MTDTVTETQSVIVERDVAFPPDKVWRALTQPHLIEEWLMKTDFEPLVGVNFSFRMDPQPNWNGVIDCAVVTVEPNRTLAYTWGSLGLESVVTWTLTATGAGTHLRMVHTGFRPDQQQAFQGAKFGWQRFFANLEQVLPRA